MFPSGHGLSYTTFTGSELAISPTSFQSGMRRELLDRQEWNTRANLGLAIFKWIEAFCNPRCRHSALGYLSPVQFEELHIAALTAA